MPWFLVFFSGFLIANVLSYFVLSDGHGVGGFQDAIKRIGFPFVFWEEGGLAWRLEFRFPVLMTNLEIGLIGSSVGAFLVSRLKP